MASNLDVVSVGVASAAGNPNFGVGRLPGQDVFGSGRVRVFLSSGTFIVPPGVTSIRVRCHGAGGSGGNGSNNPGRATGGGGGGFAMKTIAVTPGTSYGVTVGKGGVPNPTSPISQGFAGGTSSFGGLLSGTGGGAGQAVHATQALNGGAGGSGFGGDVNFTGGRGGNLLSLSYSRGQWICGGERSVRH